MVARSEEKFRPAGLRGLAAAVALLLGLAGCSGEEPPRPDFRVDAPILRGAGALEEVARLQSPLGNVAVSAGGRVFITYHPLARPAVKVAEILPDGTPVPYPDAAWQSKADGFQTPQGIVLDGLGRLWVLDHGRNGFGTPALFAFDIATGELVHRHDFKRAEAGWGSYLNDLSVDTENDTVYIADTASYNSDPALLVYDVETQKARRVLEDHASVKEEAVDMVVEGEEVKVLGVLPLRVAVDSIVLDPASEYLYYGPMSGTTMYRIRAAALRNASLPAEALAAEVQAFAPKPLSDGITIDAEGTLYLTAIEERAIMVIAPDGQGATLLRDERLVWPDGLSFGPRGWVYVTDSQVNRILFKSKEEIARAAPYILYRFRALAPGPPGH
jgi:sugar lactone lactonase YvrE